MTITVKLDEREEKYLAMVARKAFFRLLNDGTIPYSGFEINVTSVGLSFEIKVSGTLPDKRCTKCGVILRTLPEVRTECPNCGGYYWDCPQEYAVRQNIR